MKLTKADKILLRELEYNARIFEKELANMCHLSKDSVRYRMNRLKELGIIETPGAFLDHTKQGYDSYKAYFKLNATKKQKEELVKYLQTKKEVFATFEASGSWDFGIVVFTITRKEYYEFESKLLSKFGKILYSKDFCLMTEATMLQTNTIQTGNKRKKFKIWDGGEKKIDEKDKEIINELHKNAKQTLVSLSGKLGMSIDSINKRIKKLVQEGIISFFKTPINYQLLGYEKYKLFIYVKNYSD